MGEVSVVAEAGKARAVQAEGPDHSIRGQVEYRPNRLYQNSIRVLAGPTGVDAYRQRFCSADSIGQRDDTLLCQSSGQIFLATYRAMYAPLRSTLVPSFPESAPPPCGTSPP